MLFWVVIRLPETRRYWLGENRYYSEFDFNLSSASRLVIFESHLGRPPIKCELLWSHQMLFALLYDHHDQILAAAPACDQLAMGDQYWLECHQVDLNEADIFATAYREIRDPYLQKRLLELGVDESILSSAVTKEVEVIDMGGVQQRAA